MQDVITIDDHLMLRILQAKQATELAAVIEANREYLGRWLDWVASSKTIADTRKFIQDSQQRRMSGSNYEYGIFADNVLVGMIGLHQQGGTGNEPEIGYWLAAQFAGQGITSRAVEVLTYAAFDLLGVESIVICAEPDNVPSNRVAEKAGYTFRDFGHNVRVDKGVNFWEITRKTLRKA
jgi:ribosomal-protein-serine acetyltransferase